MLSELHFARRTLEGATEQQMAVLQLGLLLALLTS